MKTYKGKRLAAFTFVIRVNQLEVRLDKSIGFDESELHNPADMEQVRETFASVIPGSRVTWAFSYQALTDTRDNYAAIRSLASRYQKQYGDEITFLPGAFFSNVYNTPEEINEMLEIGVRLIEKEFGYRPRSMVAGYMGAVNQRYLAEKIGIHVCQGQIWSQMGIDNGDGDGGVLYPYYPSVSHYLKPAQNLKEQIDCVCLDGWTVDLVSATQDGLSETHNSRLGLGPIETVMKFGPEEGIREQLVTIDTHFSEGFRDNGFGLVTVNWELSLFGGKKPAVQKAWLRALLERVKTAYPDVCVETLADIGLAWRRENPDNTRWAYRFEQQGSGIGCSDPNKRVIWLMNAGFRLGFLEDKRAGSLRVIDFTDYTAAYIEPAPEDRDWSLWGMLNQKGQRPQDKPRTFGELPSDVRKTVLARYPDLQERLERGDV